MKEIIIYAVYTYNIEAARILRLLQIKSGPLRDTRVLTEHVGMTENLCKYRK